MYPFKSFLLACLILSGYVAPAQVNGHPDTLKINSKEPAAVEIEASYPGGREAWTIFLGKNVNPHIPNKNKAPIGIYTPAVIFNVNKDGSVSNIKAVTNLGYGMEDEVIRVIELSGKWNPATRNGQPLKGFRKQLITFLPINDDFQITTQVPYTLFTNTNNDIMVTAKYVKPEDISINVQGGRVIRVADGKFFVRLSKPGRVTIEILNSKKNDKEIGVASFEVKAK